MSRRLTGFYRFARGVFRIIMVPWVRMDVRGVEKLPAQGSYLLVCNHLSNIDALCLLWVMMRADVPVRIMAKAELFRVPLLGAAMRAMKLLPVHRASNDPSQVLASACEALAAGECVAIYPEGTHTQDPDFWPMRMKTGAARLALETGVPALPFVHWGEQKIMRPGSALINFLPQRPVAIRIGDPIDFSDLPSDPNNHEAVNEATHRIEENLTRAVASMRDEASPEGIWDRREKRRVPRRNAE